MVVARAQILLEGALLGIWLASGSDVNLNGVHGSESASQAIVLWLLLLLLGRAGESMAVPLSMIGLSTHAPPGSLSGEDFIVCLIPCL